MEKKLKGKIALVTGGSRGIGAATALYLSGLGATVVITYEKSVEKAQAVISSIRSAGGDGLALQADAADMKQAEQLIRTIEDTYGRLDILVNNAGVFEGIGSEIGNIPE